MGAPSGPPHRTSVRRLPLPRSRARPPNRRLAPRSGQRFTHLRVPAAAARGYGAYAGSRPAWLGLLGTQCRPDVRLRYDRSQSRPVHRCAPSRRRGAGGARDDGPRQSVWAVANPGRTRGLVLLNSYWGWNSARMPPVLKALHVPIVGGVLRARHGRDAVGAVRQPLSLANRTALGTHTPLSDELTRTFCETFAASPVARQALHRINKGLPAEINANQRRLDVPAQLQCRTLILWGGRDTYLRSHVARQFHRLIPNSELHLFHDAGHFVQVEAAVEAAAPSTPLSRAAAPRHSGAGLGGRLPERSAPVYSRGATPHHLLQMSTHRIALLPGDGIGADVVREGQLVLDTLAQTTGAMRWDMQEFPWSCLLPEARPYMPDDALDTLDRFDAILYGACDCPTWCPTRFSASGRAADSAGIRALRQSAPRALAAWPVTPLAGKKPGDFDFLCVRENSEGEYAGTGGRVHRALPTRLRCKPRSSPRWRRAHHSLRVRLGRAFGRRHVTNVTKSNALQFRPGVLG